MSDTLRKAIQRSGLTLGELSRQTGVNKGMLSRIVHGKADPRLSTVSRISTALGLHLTGTAAKKKAKRRTARKGA